MSDQIKIHLVSVADDSGYKAIAQRNKQMRKDVADGVKDVINKSNEAANKAQKAQKEVIGGIKDVSDAAKASAELAQGNIGNATMAIVKMAAQTKVLRTVLESLGKVKLGIIGIIVGVVYALYNAIKSAKEEAEKLVEEARMRRYEMWGKFIEIVGKNYKNATDEASRLAKVQDSAVASARKLADAQKELAKQRELNAAGDDAEKRAEIEFRYSKDKAQDDFKREWEDSSKAVSRLNADTKRLTESAKLYKAQMQESYAEQQKLEREIRVKKLGGDDTSKLESQLQKVTSTLDTARAKKAEVESKIADNNANRKILTDRMAILKKLRDTEEANIDEVEKGRLDKEIRDAKKKLEEERKAIAKKDAEDLKKAQDEEAKRIDAAQKEEMKNIQEAEKERLRLEKETQRKLLDERIKGIKAELTEREALSRDADSRLAAARSASSQAWSWFRDKGSLKSVMESAKADADAEIQYQREFERLKSFRKDWRTANAYGSGKMHSLSLEEEAVRRVALAREEEKTAQRAAVETRDAVVWVKEHLESIEAMKE